MGFAAAFKMPWARVGSLVLTLRLRELVGCGTGPAAAVGLGTKDPLAHRLSHRSLLFGDRADRLPPGRVLGLAIGHYPRRTLARFVGYWLGLTPSP